MGSLAALKAHIPALGHPDTAAAAAVAIDKAYRQLWADVHDLGTLFNLRQGLLARNMLYEGNTVAKIYKMLKVGHPCVDDPKVAAALLSILSALLTDVPAAFAAEGYGTHIYDVMEEGELIVPDTSELNAMRAQPIFVTLALNTLLQRPDSVDHDPHVCVGYLNDLISMDGVDYSTSTAMQTLLDDPGFRSALSRGLQTQDPHKLFKCLQILKRCVGGGPGQFADHQLLHQHLSCPWNLKQLLHLGFEQPLVTACNTVAAMVRDNAVERQLLGLLHTTLLDVFDLMCMGSNKDSSINARGHHHQQQQQQQQGRHRLSAVTSAAGSSSNSSSSSSGDGFVWPYALVTAHVGLVLEVARVAPFLITLITRMRPYCHNTALTRALHKHGPGPATSALVGVLDAAEPTDWITIQQQVEAYQVLSAVCQQDSQLALAAVAAGAPRVIHLALVEWAAFLPLASSDQGDLISDREDHIIPDRPDLPDHINLGLKDLSLHSDHDVHADHSMRSGSSGGIFEVEGVCDQVAAAAAGGSSGAAAATAAAVNQSDQISGQHAVELGSGSSRVQAPYGANVAQQQQQQQQRNLVGASQISAAVAAAMQLLLVLLKASSAYCTISSSNNSNDRSSSRDLGPPASIPCAAAAAATVQQQPAAAPAGPCCSAASLTVLCKHQGLPQLLVELGQLEIFESLAIQCLVELDKSALLPAAVQDILNAALAAAAAAAAAARPAAVNGDSSVGDLGTSAIVAHSRAAAAAAHPSAAGCAGTPAPSAPAAAAAARKGVGALTQQLKPIQV